MLDERVSSPATVGSNHYIPRFLVRRWEQPKGRGLRVFDAKTREFSRKPAKALFGGKGSDAGSTEAWLQRHVESPINKWLIGVGEGEGVLPLSDDEEHWPLYRAAAALCLSHLTRVGEANEGKERFSLHSMAAAGEQAIDRAAKFVRSIGEMFSVDVPGEDLFFTDVGHFAIPRVAQRPILAIPLSPRRLLTFAERPFSADDVESISRYPRVPSALSLGAVDAVMKIVVPPCYHKAIDDDADAFLRELGDTRQLGRELIGNIVDATARARMPPITATI